MPRAYPRVEGSEEPKTFDNSESLTIFFNYNRLEYASQAPLLPFTFMSVIIPFFAITVKVQFSCIEVVRVDL